MLKYLSIKWINSISFWTNSKFMKVILNCYRLVLSDVSNHCNYMIIILKFIGIKFWIIQPLILETWGSKYFFGCILFFWKCILWFPDFYYNATANGEINLLCYAYTHKVDWTLVLGTFCVELDVHHRLKSILNNQV